MGASFPALPDPMTRYLRALAATLMLCCAAAAPAAAKPKSTFTIRGAGFGHGVGMSQYGALGLAQHGWQAPAILAHYYTGTALGTTDPNRTVRVLLATGSRARITGARQAGTRRLNPTSTYGVRRHGAGQVDLISATGRRLATFTSPLQVAGAGGTVTLGGHGTYRGVLELSPGLFSGMTAVNAVALDDYLQGVVPAESPSNWPLEALKAQAIAARTYAITTSRGGGAFDQFADTRSQVYRGVTAETAPSNQAVADTRGQIVTYQGQPVVTYFFSTSGGRTEAVENTSLGTEPRPWLQSVEDPYDDVSPRHRWEPVTTSLARAGRRLRGLVKGSFRGIRVTRRGVSPRIVSAEVIGTRGSTPVDGDMLRARLNLYDTWAYFTTITSAPATPAPPEPTPAAPTGGATPGTLLLAPAGALRAALIGALRPAAGALRGTIVPARRGATAQVQLRDSGRWATVAHARIGRGGAYRWTANAPGTYRVLYQGAAGPAIAVR